MVKVLYFFINGFAITRYSAQETELIKIIISPRTVFEPNVNDLLNNNRKRKKIADYYNQNINNKFITKLR